MYSLTIHALQCNGVVRTRQVRVVTSHHMTGLTVTSSIALQAELFPVATESSTSRLTVVMEEEQFYKLRFKSYFYVWNSTTH